MKGKWKAYSQVLNGKRVYIAGRQKDTTKVLGGGNFETKGEYTTDKQEIINFCEKLNTEEEL